VTAPRLSPVKALIVLLAGLALLHCSPGCKREPASSSPAVPAVPTVRLYVLSTVAGAMEPCGCRKDMLGGVDHAAAFIAAESKQAPHRLVLGAGPMLFMDPVLDADRKTQDLWKAEAIAASFDAIGVAAWSPGANDFADGPATLDQLAKRSGAVLLGANVKEPALAPSRVLPLNGHRVGVAGVAKLVRATGPVPDVTVEDLEAALAREQVALRVAGAEILVALVTAERGEALRLAERVPGFDVVIVGKPYDQGEGNDAPTPAVLVGDSLVVQSPNHLQAVGVVDLFVRGGFDFADGSGVAQVERRASLTRRLEGLRARIAEWEKSGGVSAADLEARRKDVSRLEAELATLSDGAPPASGSYFQYRLVEIREAFGSEPAVLERMNAYYKRVNEHNRVAFKDRVPAPVPPGQSGYLGAEECSNCHEEAHAFWKATPHANAYATLVEQHKQFNLECVSCHVTGYGKPGGSTVTHVGALQAVQCENCHGPGSRHEKDPENKAFITRVPDRSLCQKCHHPPHVADEWSVDDAWPKVIGPGHGM
jgi:hypothetical protein